MSSSKEKKQKAKKGLDFLANNDKDTNNTEEEFNFNSNIDNKVLLDTINNVEAIKNDENSLKLEDVDAEYIPKFPVSSELKKTDLETETLIIIEENKESII